MPEGHLGPSAPATEAAFTPAMAWDQATIGAGGPWFPRNFLVPDTCTSSPHQTLRANSNQGKSNNWIYDLTKDEADHLVVKIIIPASV
jgi:hypothetical protein